MPADPPSPARRGVLDLPHQGVPHRPSPADRLQGDEDVALEDVGIPYRAETLVPGSGGRALVIEERHQLGMTTVHGRMPGLGVLVRPIGDVGGVLPAPGPEHRREGRVASLRNAAPAIGPVCPLLRAVLEIHAHHPLSAAGEGEGVAEAGVIGHDERQLRLHDAQHLLELPGRRRDRTGPPRHPHLAER